MTEATSTELAQRTPQQALVAQVRGATFKEQIAMALPPSVTADRFTRIAVTAILTNPDIAKLEHESVLRAMVQCAAAGLMPDGKEAAIVNRGSKGVFTPMIGGFRKIAAEHGWSLRTAVVYANDEFDHSVVDGEETITHRPVRPGGDRGDLIAAYAIAKHRDGRKMMAVLHPDDVAKRRSSASTQKVWNEHTAAMWEKSAGRDLFEQLGLADADRVKNVLSAEGLEPEQALYGPTTTIEHRELPRTGPSEAESQQAETAAAAATDRPADHVPVAVSVPGDEPAFDGDEPPEPTTFEPPAAVADEVEQLTAAADEAGSARIPTGRHAGKSIAEVAESGPQGENYLLWMLKNWKDAPLRDSVGLYAQVHLPDVWQRYQEHLDAHQED